MTAEIETALYEVTATVVVRVREESTTSAGQAVALGWVSHGLPHCQSVEAVTVGEVRRVAE